MEIKPVQYENRLRNQFSILLAVFLLAAVTFRLMEVPAQLWSLGNVLGSPLALVLGPTWISGISLSLLALTGAYALLRQHPAWEQRVPGWWARLITPALAALLLGVFLHQLEPWTVWLRVLLLTSAGIGGLVYVTYQAFGADESRAAVLRLVLNIVDYALAFVAFDALVRSAGRGMVLVPAVMLVQGLLALEILSVGAMTRRTMLYAALAALVAGELVWAWSYWPVAPRVIGIWLTLSLYGCAGLGSLALWGRLERRAVLEFLVLALVVGLGALLVV